MRIDAASSEDVKENAVLSVRAEGMSLLLVRVEGTAHAVENRCPHLGLSMARGSVDGSRLECPWHRSRFDVCTGENLDWVNGVAGIPMPKWTHSLIAMGKSPAPLRTFATSEEAGRVWVEVPDR